MIQLLLFLMMIGEGLAGLTCYESSNYYLSDVDKCWAPDFNTAFNNGEDLMMCDDCDVQERVSISFVWL